MWAPTEKCSGEALNDGDRRWRHDPHFKLLFLFLFEEHKYIYEACDIKIRGRYWKNKKMRWSSSMCHSHWCVTCMSPWWLPASPFPSVFFPPSTRTSTSSSSPAFAPCLLPCSFLTLILSFLFLFQTETLSTNYLDSQSFLFLNIFLVRILMEVKISMKRRGVCQLAGCKFQNMNISFLSC